MRRVIISVVSIVRRCFFNLQVLKALLELQVFMDSMVQRVVQASQVYQAHLALMVRLEPKDHQELQDGKETLVRQVPMELLEIQDLLEQRDRLAIQVDYRIT